MSKKEKSMPRVPRRPRGSGLDRGAFHDRGRMGCDERDLPITSDSEDDMATAPINASLRVAVVPLENAIPIRVSGIFKNANIEYEPEIEDANADGLPGSASGEGLPGLDLVRLDLETGAQSSSHIVGEEEDVVVHNDDKLIMDLEGTLSDFSDSSASTVDEKLEPSRVVLSQPEIETRVHYERCLVYGQSYMDGTLTVPCWARVKHGKYMDYIVGHHARDPMCACAALVSTSDVMKCIIVPKTQPTLKRQLTESQFYFTHVYVVEADSSPYDTVPPWRVLKRDPLLPPEMQPEDPAVKRRRLYAQDPRNFVHVGDHSVTGLGGGIPALKAVNRGDQNLLTWLQQRIGYDDINIVESADHATMGVRSTIAVGDEGYQPRVQNVEARFNIWVEPGANAVRVTARYGRRVDLMSYEMMSGFMIDRNNFNTRAVASSIQAAVGTPYAVSQAMATCVDLSRARDDNTSLYAKGWLLALMKAQIERAGDQPNPYVPAWLPSGGQYVHRSWEAADLATFFQNDIQNRVFILLGRDFSPEQQMCLQHLARGGIAIGAQARTAPILNQISWFGINIAVYFSGPVNMPAIADFNSDTMRATLIQLAQTRGERLFLVRGFVKALTLLGVREFPADANGQGRHSYAATLEVFHTFHWPRPSDSNPVWRWLSTQPAMNVPEPAVGELGALSHFAMNELLSFGIVGSAIISNAISLAFNTFNLYGRALNRAVSPAIAVQSQLYSFARQLFQSTDNTAVPPIFSFALNEITHVTQIVIDEQAFIQDAWNANHVGAVNINNNNWWSGDWDFRIPYLLDPLSVSFVYEMWPSQYGFFRSDVAVDLKSDLVISGPNRGWYASLGDSTYKAYAEKGVRARPCDYIHYGATVINAFAQEWRVVVPYPMQYQSWARGYDTTATGAPLGQADALDEDRDWYPDINSLKPGSIRTYNWEDDVVLSPMIAGADLGNEHWTGLRSNPRRRCIYAGLRADNMLAITGMPLVTWDPLARYAGESSGTSSISAPSGAYGSDGDAGAGSSKAAPGAGASGVLTGASAALN
uniref:Putative capsid protein n=2 Tax=Atrato virus TaxID=2689336 RepID=A0A6B9KNY5_9VIRU|nr:putative capsid protein [Atrato virus]